MISFVITLKYLYVYDKEIFDLKLMGYVFICYIGIIKLVYIYYCIYVYMYLKKKKGLFWMCIWKLNYVLVI